MAERQKIQFKEEDLLSIRDMFFAGRAALEKEQLPELLKRFKSNLNDLVTGRLFADNPNIISVWNDIFESVFPAHLQDELAESMDKKLYYEYGNYLTELTGDDSELSHDSICKLIHSYLNIFRLPKFLVKIYGERKWDELIYELVLKSNYNISEMFKQRVNIYDNKTLFKVIQGRSETDFNWNKTAEIVNRYSKSIAYQLQDVDKVSGYIAFIMENSVHMAMLDLACLTSGIVNIMIPANSVPQHVSFILNEIKAPIVIVSDEKQLAKIKAVKKDLSFLKKVILHEGGSALDWVINFKDFTDSGQNLSEGVLDEIQKKTSMKSLSTIMYTSGTTGDPKGIMFSQMNIVYKRFCRAMALPEIGDHDRFLAYLPLYHTFGRWLEMTGSVFWGATYAFMENPSVETMISNMRQFQPTVFISIPKKWQQLYESVSSKIDIEIDEEQDILYTLNQLTGGKLKWGLSAAGFLPPEVFQFFQKYGTELMSGFGMTEATGGITMTPPGEYIPNSLGRSLPGIEIKVADDGELLIRGPYVMEGYFGMEESETFLKGKWLPTGDVMRIDENEFIEIIDRKKEIYKNVKGETIAPQKIENYFRDFEEVQQVFLVGDHRPFNTVLLYPNYEVEKIKISEFDETQKREYFSSLIVTVNKFLAPFERILDFRIIDRPFSVDKGELTPKSTYKRRVIENNFQEIIEAMYSKDHSSVICSGMEVRIPNWFLREKGCLSGDLLALPGFISIPKLEQKIVIEKVDETKNLFRTGDYLYEINSPYIDFQLFLTNPLYWCGNVDLINFTGDSIFQWYRQNDEDQKVIFHSKVKNRIPEPEALQEMKRLLTYGELSLYGIHHALMLLQSNSADDGNTAVQYLRIILDDDTLPVYKLVVNLMHRPMLADTLNTRREMFKSVTPKLKGKNLRSLFEIYLGLNNDLLDDNVIKVVVDKCHGAEYLSVFEDVLQHHIENFESSKNFESSVIPFLFNLLGTYGIHHPTSYRRIRQTFVQYQLVSDLPKAAQLAEEARNRMQTGFRNWLGANQNVAVDVETGEEYHWSDVITIEQEIEPENKKRIVNSITNTAVLREAIFLFTEGVLIRLNDILPGGIWVSRVKSFKDITIYRISVQTRMHGAFDVIFSLNNNLSTTDVIDEVNWLILTGSRYLVMDLVEDFGGYWEENELWSQKYMHGDSVAKYFQRESRKKEEENRLRYQWPYFVWNASAAYFNFWKLTGFRLVLVNPTTENIIMPVHDYQTGTRFVSLSNRVEFESVRELFRNLYAKFIETTEDSYPFLKKASVWNYIFSGVIDSLGINKGFEILNHLLEELKNSDDSDFDPDVVRRLEIFQNSIKADGFIPKTLFFAIKRFHRWFKLNRNASLSAQAEMLYELYETYNLSELEKLNPETRTRFFFETAFANSSKSIKKAIGEIIFKQREKQLSKDETLVMISDMQNEFDLSEDEAFFLTRLSYPHLKPTDSAALLKVKSAGDQAANLVVQFEDYDGQPYSIRKPITPKEISRLHQLFFDANLLVHFHPEHQFLVAVSERGYIIGGLFYSEMDEQTSHMEKIVVSNRYRRKGISEGLMNEFFNRLRDSHYKYVTTGFFRPEYFYRFGFKIERKYSGLVKEL